MGAQGVDAFLSELRRGVACDQLQRVAWHQAREEEVDGDGKEEGDTEFEEAAGHGGNWRPETGDWQKRIGELGEFLVDFNSVVE